MHDWKNKWEDYYGILGISSDADQEAIKKAYKDQIRIHHPDRMQGWPESTRKSAEEELKKINRAYENLVNPQDRQAYHSEWLKRKGQTSEKTPPRPRPIPKPKPIVNPPEILFENVEPLWPQQRSFIVSNVGGPYHKLSISYLDPWISIFSSESISTTYDELPKKVTISVKGDDWGKTYSGRVCVKLDDIEIYLPVTLKTSPAPPKPKPVVNPLEILVNNIEPGRPTFISFMVSNDGGPYSKASIHSFDPWIDILSGKTIRGELPKKVTINVKGDDWDKTYSGRICVNLDDVEIYLPVTLKTSPAPPKPNNFDDLESPTHTRPAPKKRDDKFKVRVLAGYITGVIMILIGVLSFVVWHSSPPGVVFTILGVIIILSAFVSKFV